MNIRRLSETQIASWIASTIDTDVKIARIPQELVMPCILVNCSNIKPYEANMALYECNIDISVISSIAEEDADTKHQERVAEIIELTEAHEDMAEGITGNGLECKGLRIDEISGEPNDISLVDTITIKAFCNLT